VTPIPFSHTREAVPRSRTTSKIPSSSILGNRMGPTYTPRDTRHLHP
jgi:hypothetical protein